MFLAGRIPVQVAIDLDLEPDMVISILYDFLRLQSMHKATTILKENKDHLAPFVKLLEVVKKNITRVKDIRYAMDSINNIKARKAKEQTEGGGPIKKRERDYLLDNLGDIKRSMLLNTRLILLLKEDLGYPSFINSITACLGSMLFSFKISNSFSGSLSL